MSVGFGEGSDNRPAEFLVKIEILCETPSCRLFRRLKVIEITIVHYSLYLYTESTEQSTLSQPYLESDRI